MTEPTEQDYETGRALAEMAEADGAVSDGADIPWMIAHEIAKARAEGAAAALAGFDAFATALATILDKTRATESEAADAATSIASALDYHVERGGVAP